MKIFISLAPIAISLLSIFISIINLKIIKRSNISNVISNNRIKWMNHVRELFEVFLENYIMGENEIELKIIKSKIDLYIRFDSIFYKELEEKLTYCVTHKYTEDDYKELASWCQKFMNNAWVRIKREAGISEREEKEIEQYLLKYK
ncbi:MAG: hypothetical protein HDQ95_04800 [Roseburia sp.]|nr:hypothetical protein [Roseburia sp.]